MSKKSKKRIGFDLDGVLADHKKNRRKVAKKLGVEENSREVKKVIYGEMSLTAGVIRGAKKAVKRLSKEFDVFIVSRRNFRSRKVAEKWLKEHFNFSSKNIFFVSKDEDKAKVIKKLDLDFFIDDKISVLFHIKGGVKKFLFDEIDFYKKEQYGSIKVIRSFDEFLKLVI